ncbi:MAG: hypothetical protein ABJB66_14460 [Gemmatimonadaceae bacterium]
MTLRPLYGFTALRHRLAESVLSGQLPASLLFTGSRGVGKQRLALWLGQLLLCERAAAEKLQEPCGSCVQCRYAVRGQHPDLHWFFPRPKLKDPDPEIADIKADLAEAISERMQQDGLWATPPGTDGIYIASVRALVQMASVRPAMAKRTVFVVGDAERMVSQLGSDQAANAFLKLLEEPPPYATIVLTTSEPGALLPTIRSRVVTVRVPLAQPADVAAFLDDPSVVKKLKGVSREQAMASAAGAPGILFGAESTTASFANAKRILDAALGPLGPAGAGERVKVAAKQGSFGARGSFTDTLDALTILLHDRARQLVLGGHDRHARRAAQAVVAVEAAKEKAQGNVSPQLLSASLVASLHELLN